MDLMLKNEIVVVSGSAGIRGSIGHTLITALANEGTIPVLVDRNERVFTYQQELLDKGIDSLFVQTDMTQPNQTEKAIEKIGK